MMCVVCGIDKPRIETKIKRGKGKINFGFYKVDDKNKKWNGLQCPECKKIKDTESRRRKGIRSIDDVNDPILKLGRESERKVSSFFESLGFKTELTNRYGVDLAVTDEHGKKFKIEIKTASKRRNRKEQYRTGSFGKSSWGCDFVAFVLPNNNIVIQPMKTHKKFCNRDGSRCVNNMVKEMK